jgi:hypothetical protein
MSWKIVNILELRVSCISICIYCTKNIVYMLNLLTYFTFYNFLMFLTWYNTTGGRPVLVTFSVFFVQYFFHIHFFNNIFILVIGYHRILLQNENSQNSNRHVLDMLTNRCRFEHSEFPWGDQLSPHLLMLCKEWITPPISDLFSVNMRKDDVMTIMGCFDDGHVLIIVCVPTIVARTNAKRQT